MKNNNDEVAIFWDYENCPAPSNASGYDIVNTIRSIAQTFGSVTMFKAYLEITEQVAMSRALLLRSELQSSGVSLTDCPHNGRKDVADKMIIVDMLAHAIDNPAPSTIMLISGDHDFAYALSILRLRCYHIVLITLSNSHPSLRQQASLSFDWNSEILEQIDSNLSYQPTSPRRGKTSAPPVLHRSYSDTKNHNHSGSHFQESHNKKSSRSVEFINYLKEKTSSKEHSLTPPKHDISLPPDLDQSKKQPSASSITSSALRNGSTSSARVIPSPATSSESDLNDTTETLLTTTDSHDSNSSQTKPSTSHATTPKLEFYGLALASRFSPHVSLRGSTSLPNLIPHEVASFESATETRMLLPESDLRRSSPSSPYPAKTQSALNANHMDGHKGDPSSPLSHLDVLPPPYFTAPSTPSIMPAETQSLSSVDDMDDYNGDSSSALAHSDIPPAPNVTAPLSSTLSIVPPLSSPQQGQYLARTQNLSSVDHVHDHGSLLVTHSEVPSLPTPPSASAPSSSSLNHDATMSTAAASTLTAATGLPPMPSPVIPDKFKILVQCLQSHRLKGTLRPLRSKISVEIAEMGATYRQTGVLMFREYTAMAEKAGIIELGGSEGTAWIALREPWFNLPASASALLLPPNVTTLLSTSTPSVTPASSSPQQGAYLAEIPSVDHECLPLAHLEVPPPPNRTTPPSASAPSPTPPSSLSHATVPAVAQSLVKEATPLPPPPALPDNFKKFKILVQCLNSHTSKGRLRPLRSEIAEEIAQIGATDLRTGVLMFREYTAMAEMAGIIKLGGSEGTAWIALREPWVDLPLSGSALPPPNVTASPSASAPSSTPPSSLSHATVSAAAENTLTTATLLPPTSSFAVPDNFKILVQCLQSHRSKGNLRPLHGEIVAEIILNRATYQQAGVSMFHEYAAMAEKAGIIELGSSEGTAWIGLREPWSNAPLSASTPAHTPLSSLNHYGAQKPVKTTTPLQPTPFPAVPDKFKILVQCLQLHRARGSPRPLRTHIADAIGCNGATYRQAGVSKFGKYIVMAESMGIVELGGPSSGAMWIALREPWCNASLS